MDPSRGHSPPTRPRQRFDYSPGPMHPDRAASFGSAGMVGAGQRTMIIRSRLQQRLPPSLHRISPATPPGLQRWSMSNRPSILTPLTADYDSIQPLCRHGAQPVVFGFDARRRLPTIHLVAGRMPSPMMQPWSFLVQRTSTNGRRCSGDVYRKRALPRLRWFPESLLLDCRPESVHRHRR